MIKLTSLDSFYLFVQLDGISREWNTRSSESVVISERRLIKAPRINGLSSPRKSERHRDTTNPLGHLPEECMFLQAPGFGTPAHTVSSCIFRPTFPPIYTSASLGWRLIIPPCFICAFHGFNESVNQITLLRRWHPVLSDTHSDFSRWSPISVFIQNSFAPLDSLIQRHLGFLFFVCN